MGDLNADFNTFHGKHLENFAKRMDLSILITEPTRITPLSATVLDQFITNVPSLVDSCSVLPPLCNNDHGTIALQCNLDIPNRKPYERKIWNYNLANFDAFRHELDNINFDFCNDIKDIDEACLKWSELFLTAANLTIPNKIATIRPNDKPWYNGNLRKLLRIKNRSYKVAKSKNEVSAWADF
jgi:hypothetical protein